MVNQAPGTKDLADEEMRQHGCCVQCPTEKAGAPDPEAREGLWARLLAHFVVAGWCRQSIQLYVASVRSWGLGLKQLTPRASRGSAVALYRAHPKRSGSLGHPQVSSE